MELFIPSRDWAKLKRRLEAYADEVTYFAGNARGEFESSDAESINPVTWGVFRGKEYVTSHSLFWWSTLGPVTDTTYPLTAESSLQRS